MRYIMLKQVKNNHSYYVLDTKTSQILGPYLTYEIAYKVFITLQEAEWFPNE